MGVGVNLIQDVQRGIEAKTMNFLSVKPEKPKPGQSPYFEGLDPGGKPRRFAWPQIVLERRSMEGNPPAVWFEKNYSTGKITMTVQLKIEPISVASNGNDGSVSVLNTIAHSVSLFCKDMPKKKMKVDRSGNNIEATWSLTLDELAFLKKQLATKDSVKIIWSAEIPCVVMKSATELRAYQQHFLGQGTDDGASIGEASSLMVEDSVTLPVIDPDKGDYDSWSYFAKSAYGKVRGLLSWEHVKYSGGHEVWYKEDSRAKSTYYFMPQIFRITANQYTNDPNIKLAQVEDKRTGEYRTVVEFKMGPYYKPSAKRDLFKEIYNLTGRKTKYCLLNYGGYDSAEFVWNKDYLNGSILGSLVSHPFVKEDSIKVSPDSSFSLSFDFIADQFSYFQKHMIEDKQGIPIGTVVLTTKEGVNLEHERKIEIPAELDLRAMTQFNLGIEQLVSDKKKINFPYKVKITNPGENTLEIGGWKLSYLAKDRKTGQLHDMHLGISSRTPSPIRLEKGASKTIELSETSINDLLKKNSLLGLPLRRYWTELVCEPESIRLLDCDIERIMLNKEDLASNHIEVWTLELHAEFTNNVIKNLTDVWIWFQNDRGTDTQQRMPINGQWIKVEMASTLRAILETQNDTSRNYTYKIKVFTQTGESGWSEPKKGFDPNVLILYNEDVLPLINSIS